MPRHVLLLGIALAFLVGAATLTAYFVPDTPLRMLLVLGAAAAGYMALNIGANDVANNMGPAVGARAISMGAALILAALLDAGGAFLAGGQVIDTVAHDLLTPATSFTAHDMILVMIAALLAAASWLNISTVFGAPVSTTHAIVGGVVGAAVMAGGLGTVAWPTIGLIATTWTISPLLGAALAGGIHGTIRLAITRRTDKLAAARRWIPVLVAAMAGTFALYLVTSTAFGHWRSNQAAIIWIGSGAAAGGWMVSHMRVTAQSRHLENRKKQVALLFRPPLLVAAALLSFAHGSNDVANAVGPLLAIIKAANTSLGGAPISVPLWALAIGALGIAVGIGLFGPRVVRTIGEEITKLNEIRAFCVALAASLTVLAASTFGLPISSTHVTVGAVFGVGFLREYLAMRNIKGSGMPTATGWIDPAMLNHTAEQAAARNRRYGRRLLVRRFNLLRIGAAWLVTLPASAILGGFMFALLDTVVP